MVIIGGVWCLARVAVKLGNVVADRANACLARHVQSAVAAARSAALAWDDAMDVVDEITRPADELAQRRAGQR